MGRVEAGRRSGAALGGWASWGRPAGSAAGRPSLPLQKMITPRTFKTIGGFGPDGNRHDSAVPRFRSAGRAMRDVKSAWDDHFPGRSGIRQAPWTDLDAELDRSRRRRRRRAPATPPARPTLGDAAGQTDPDRP